MIKAEQVPKETVEAAAVQLSNGRSTAQAIAAALNAWPGSYSLAGNDSAVIRDVAVIILPFLEENSDE